MCYLTLHCSTKYNQEFKYTSGKKMSVTNLSAHSMGGGGGDQEVVHTAEYLSWRKLHLAKSKLSNVCEMASFMAGFAVVATVELQINDEDANPALLVAFVVTTALLVGTSMMAIMISTCLLPHIQAVAKMSLISQVGQSPHERMAHLVDLSWVMANTASLFFFTLDVILLCWIKFTYFSPAASIAATAIMGPVLVIILLFGVAFYRKITKHQYVLSTMKFEELERMKEQLDREDSLVLAMSKAGSAATMHTVQSNQNLQNQPSHRVLQALQRYDSPRASLRSRDSSDSEGSFSKRSRSRGSIFIV
ncbi:calcium release-activated calcium channel protein 1 isoform X2 [Folsomia candida]|uniref:calcium release-activated calcium channel protein 1 isoform X2 n=1 Tax=Folsomia candida TaxID=158441 RepID=UPI001604F1E1|nr:calcium release-activated calcium channel protein 1 isoform X2 [Folsomia candida]